jgi:hypothetical protein
MSSHSKMKSCEQNFLQALYFCSFFFLEKLNIFLTLSPEIHRNFIGNQTDQKYFHVPDDYI